MVDWRDTYRRSQFYGAAFSRLVDEWLPGLYGTTDGRHLIEDLRRLSTVPSTTAGDRLINRALSPNRGPLIVPERPGIADMSETINAYVHPDDKGKIKFNLALLRAFGELQDDETTANFVKGTLLHELVHWCRLNNTDKSKRGPRDRDEFGQKLERLFHGLPENGRGIEKSNALLRAYYHHYDQLTGGVSHTEMPLAKSSTPRRKSMSDKRRASLAKIPLHYDRFNPDRSDYGTIGKPINPFINVEFAARCDEMFADLKARMQPHFGNLKVIVTGGIHRKGSGASLHHQNRAFDLDGLAFESGKLWRADSFPSDPHLYLAIESDIRRHFSTVLTYDYNTEHQDHIHFDDGRKNRFRKTTRTHALYVQHALNLVYLRPVGVDGVWGPETKEAVSEIRDQLKIGSFREMENWMTFCDVTADHAIGMAV